MVDKYVTSSPSKNIACRSNTRLFSEIPEVLGVEVELGGLLEEDNEKRREKYYASSKLLYEK